MATDNVVYSGNPWLPGSFTKNFSWGKGSGLRKLYDNIRRGFQDELTPVRRDVYLQRVGADDARNLVPLNFFLLNSVRDGLSYVEVDELVFQALTCEYSIDFDRTALFSFNFSHAGKWLGQKRGQRYPALWATAYILEKVVAEYDWNTSFVSALDIEKFLRISNRFIANSSHRKVSTNLKYLYDIGGLQDFGWPRIQRWWVNSLFLALDRIVLDRSIDGLSTPMEILPNLLTQRYFLPLSGKVSHEKTFAIAHLISLYSICGGIDRFDPDRVRDLVAIKIPDYNFQIPNDERPVGALHPTNPRILKSIPRDCIELARLAGFEIVLPDDLTNFDSIGFIRQRISTAIDQIQNDGIRPILSSDELYKITRGE
jgi:hypothetical protein